VGCVGGRERGGGGCWGWLGRGGVGVLGECCGWGGVVFVVWGARVVWVVWEEERGVGEGLGGGGGGRGGGVCWVR